MIASRNKIFCVFHPAKAITQTNWSEGDTLLEKKENGHAQGAGPHRAQRHKNAD